MGGGYCFFDAKISKKIGYSGSHWRRIEYTSPNEWLFKKWELKAGIGNDAAVTLNYGNFIQSTFEFLVIAFSIFIFIKALNRLTNKKKQEPDPAPPTLSNEEKLLTEIRDLLKSNSKNQDIL